MFAQIHARRRHVGTVRALRVHSWTMLRNGHAPTSRTGTLPCEAHRGHSERSLSVFLRSKSVSGFLGRGPPAARPPCDVYTQHAAPTAPTLLRRADVSGAVQHGKYVSHSRMMGKSMTMAPPERPAVARLTSYPNKQRKVASREVTGATVAPRFAVAPQGAALHVRPPHSNARW